MKTTENLLMGINSEKGSDIEVTKETDPVVAVVPATAGPSGHTQAAAAPKPATTNASVTPSITAHDPEIRSNNRLNVQGSTTPVALSNHPNPIPIPGSRAPPITATEAESKTPDAEDMQIPSSKVASFTAAVDAKGKKKLMLGAET